MKNVDDKFLFVVIHGIKDPLELRLDHSADLGWFDYAIGQDVAESFPVEGCGLHS